MIRDAIALTPGDPSGVGPEVAMHLLSQLPEGGRRPLVFGDRRILGRAASWLGLTLDWVPVTGRDDLGRLGPGDVGWWDVPWTEASLPALGTVDAACGAYALRTLQVVGPLLAEGLLPAVVTGPISKEAIQLTTPDFIGHTEFFARIGRTDRFGMLLVVDPLRAIHVTSHVALSEVPTCLTIERILETIELAGESLSLLGEPSGAIAVCGLNPHAGEAGRFGTEEIDRILPAIRLAQAKGLNVSGPLPPDTVFYRALAGEFRVIVCMYHDQGHIPLKMIGFDRGVNVTVGLPFIRTSVDHGTAYDLAGTGQANPGSLRAAWDLAQRLLDRRQGLADRR